MLRGGLYNEIRPGLKIMFAKTSLSLSFSVRVDDVN